MSSKDTSRDDNESEESSQSSKSKLNKQANLKGQGNHKYVATRIKANGNEKRTEHSKEKTGLWQNISEEHPIITAKRKSTNLTLVVQSRHPQESEPHREARGYTVSKPTQRKTCKPPIPDRWGQETTGPITDKITVARSTLRDHPYIPTKRQNFVIRCKKNRKEVFTSQRSTKFVNDAESSCLNAKARINPEEEFNKLNEKIANKIHEDKAATFHAGQTMFNQNEDKDSMEMVSLHPDENLVEAKSNQIREGGSRELLVDESSLSVHVCANENVSPHQSNTPKSTSHLQVSNEPSLEEITTIIRSRQRVPSYKKETAPKFKSPKSSNLFVQRKPESYDSSKKPIEVTELTETSEMSIIGFSDNDASHEVDAVAYKMSNFLLRNRQNTSTDNVRLVSSTSAPIEETEERLSNLTSQFSSFQHEDKVILKEDEASNSEGQELMTFKSRQSVTDELPMPVAVRSSIGRSLTEPSKISLINSNLSLVTASSILLKGSSSSFLSTSPIPEPQDITCSSKNRSQRKVTFLRIDSRQANNEAEQVRIAECLIASEQRQEVVYFDNRSQVSLSLVISNSVINAISTLAENINGESEQTDMASLSVVCLNALGNEHVCILFEITNQWLNNLNACFLDFVIPSASIPIHVPITDEQRRNQFSLNHLVDSVIGQVTGTFGLKLFRVIRNFSWVSINKIVRDEAKQEGYDKGFIAQKNMSLLVNPLMQNFINPIIWINKNNESIFLRLIHTRCEMIHPNSVYSDNHQIGSAQLFAEVVWTEVAKLFVPCHAILRDSVCHVLQMTMQQGSVSTVPQLLDIPGLTPNKLHAILPIFNKKPEAYIPETDDILTSVERNVIRLILPVELSRMLLHPINAQTNIVEHQWQVQRCDVGTFLLHDAVNPTLALLLGERLARFFDFTTNSSKLPLQKENGEFENRQYVMDGVVTCNVRPASSTIIMSLYEQLPALIGIPQHVILRNRNNGN